MARTLHYGRHAGQRRAPEQPTRAQLLAPVQRWTFARKGILLQGIRASTITFPDACAAHGLSSDELAAWFAAWNSDGFRALRSTVKSRRRA